MKKALVTLALVWLGSVNSIQAEVSALVRINRFFGIGWSDGYHAPSNSCAVCNGTGMNCTACQANGPVGEPLPGPTSQPGTHSNSPTEHTRFNTDRSQIISFVRLDRTAAPAILPTITSPRLVRLPAVVDQPAVARASVTRRLPPVTKFGARSF